ncbi:MAG TPA: hypothetical protein VMJ32_12660 [Pirellulales bacterium]|nr:hypothetical protein [Pirellulales bacterium]
MAAASLAALWSAASLAAVPSFPGADGAGAAATGGSGGSVYHVTVLDSKLGDLTPGTLQYGLKNASGPTTIVFDVGGTIWLGLKTTDNEGWDTQNSINIPPNVTIAGQTAPGGITLMGAQIKVNGQTVAGQTLPQGNDIIRDVTLAIGYGERKANGTSNYYDNYTYDNMDINSNQVIVDHVTALFATDESISANEMASHVTVQYSTIAQGQSYPQADAQNNGVYTSHAFGDLWGLGSNAVSTFSHNLYANENGRIPTIQTVSSKLTNNVPAYTDFRDNVVYNWFGHAGYGSSGEPGAGEFEGNYYKVGPGGDSSSGNNTDFTIHQSAGGTSPFSNSSSTMVYQTGNVLQNTNGTTTTLANSSFGSSPLQSGPYTQIPYNGVTDTAAVAYNQVLNYVGANWQNRDSMDTRLVNEVMTGTGKIAAFDDPNNGFNSAGVYMSNDPNDPDLEWNKLLELRSANNPGVSTANGVGATGSTYTRPANFDTDGDGMPDVWELAMGLNPAVADNNGSVMNDGYTNLDSYLNELAAWPASTALIFSNGNGNGRYAEIGNWQTGVYKPTRYDTVQCDSGTVTIDVVGQHAGTLKIATSSGNTATLAVTAGWLDVAQDLMIGPGGNGQVNQTGGIVRAGNSVVIGGTNHAGTYTLSAGTLATPLLTQGAMGGTFNFTGGTLHANTVNFSLTNAGGVLAPGSDLNLQLIAAASMPDINDNLETILPFVGSTHVVGNLTLQSGSLQIDLASLASFDTIAVDSQLSLGGSLDVVLDNSYLPKVGDSWKIGAASSISGNFASIAAGFSTNVQGGSLFLEFTGVPEPGSMTLGWIGSLSLLGLCVLRRKRA